MNKNEITVSTKKITVGTRELTIRKWKGKDKRNFINALKKSDIHELDIMDSLVYSCIIEDDIVLSPDEFKHVLTQIRVFSLGDDVSYNFFCEACGETTEHEFKMTEILKPEFSNENIIQTENFIIELGNIKNKKFYLDKIKEDDIYDFLLRIKKVNDNDTFDIDYLMDIFDEMDVGELQDVMDKWEDIRFKVNDINKVTCGCGQVEEYSFDEIPEFFPKEWFMDSSIIGYPKE